MEAHVGEHLSAAAIVALIGAFITIFGLVCGFIIAIFKRQGTIRDAMVTQVETINVKMDGVKKDIFKEIKEVDLIIRQYKDGWDKRREAIIALMIAHCEDHRRMCSAGMVEKISHVEQRCLNGVESVGRRTETACQKIAELKQMRERQWEKQEGINQKLLSGRSAMDGQP